MDSNILGHSMIPWIGRSAKMMGMFMTAKFKAHEQNLTTKQWILLRILHQKDGQRQNDLALVTDRNKASLARLIDTMEKKQLVTRVSFPEDKRVNQIFLTKHGREVFAESIPTMQQIATELEAGITPEEIQTVIEVLQKVMKNATTE